MFSINNGRRYFKKKPGLFHAGILYSALVIIFLYAGSRLQHRGFNSGILLTEFVLFMLPALLFMYGSGYDIVKVFRIKSPGVKNILNIFLIMLTSVPLIGFFNMLNYKLIELIFGRITLPQIPIASDFPGLMMNILVIGVSAGICEEIVFRGVILRSFERFGGVRAVVFTAILFGIMHVDFQRFLGTFLLGVLIGFIVYRSGSIFCGMFAHFTVNSIMVLLMFALLHLKSLAAEGGASLNQTADMSAVFASMPGTLIAAVLIFWGAFLAASTICFFYLVRSFVRRNAKVLPDRGFPGGGIHKNEKNISFRTAAAFAPGIMYVMFIWVVQMLSLKGLIGNEMLMRIFSAAGMK